MTNRDRYYNQAKQEGYRSRAAYKLKQLDEAVDLLSDGDTVVDLGAAPGGWLQVAAEGVGQGGTVVGVDRQRIDPLEETHGATVETIRGDMTDEETKEAIRDRVGDREDGGGVDVVVSDMAPNVSGEYELDHARSVHLARQAFETATDVLASGGAFVVKVFDGPDFQDFRRDVEREFEYVRTTSPDASRESSSELYLVAKGFLTAPVRVGDRVTVDIEDVGSEGDGVAKVEGYTLFVPDVDRGDTVEVEVTDVKARFGFAEAVD
jgi:23S rRNA (uridine2552-2'-O)-methyltransferase